MRTAWIVAVLLGLAGALPAHGEAPASLVDIGSASIGASLREDRALAAGLASRCEALLVQEPANPVASYWLAFNRLTLLGSTAIGDRTGSWYRDTRRATEESLRALAEIPQLESEACVLLECLLALDGASAPSRTADLAASRREFLARAERSDPSNPRVWLRMGVLGVEAGAMHDEAPGRADELLLKAVDLAMKQTRTDQAWPDWGLVESQAMLGRACEEAGQLDEARHLYEEVLARRPDYALVARTLLPGLVRRLSGLGELGLSPVFAGTPEARAALDEVLACERSMNNLALEHGMREAYLAYLAEDALCFRTGPVRERPIQEQRPRVWPVTFRWSTELADVSAAGDLALTFGPVHIYKNEPGGARLGCEHGLSLWRREPDGSWRQVFDAGVSHGPMELAIRRILFPGRPWTGREAVDVEREALELLGVDRGFGARLGSSGLEPAYGGVVAESVILCREGAFPRFGKGSLGAHLAGLPGTWTWSPTGAAVARSGDLGYSYGTFDRRVREAGQDVVKSSSYVRVWKRDGRGDWRVLVELSVRSPRGSS